MDISNFVCCICRNIPDSVAESGCCHSIFCWSCVLENGNRPCPSCQKTLKPEMCNENAAIQKLIDKIPTACKNEGCGVSVAPSAMSAHVEVCEYATVMCPNSDLCGLLTRRDLATHERDRCLYRAVMCHSCEVPLPLNELQSHLEHECPNGIVECVHNCATKGIRRHELPQHLATECMNVPVACPFAAQGCDHHILLRGELEAHVRDNAGKHLVMMKSLVEDQQQEIAALREEVRVLRNAGPGVQYINFQQVQELLCDRLESLYPWANNIYMDVRPRLRLAAVFWIFLSWFILSHIPFGLRLIAIVWMFVKGYKKYVEPFKRPPHWARYPTLHTKVINAVYITACIFVFLLVLILC